MLRCWWSLTAVFVLRDGREPVALAALHSDGPVGQRGLARSRTDRPLWSLEAFVIHHIDVAVAEEGHGAVLDGLDCSAILLVRAVSR